MTDLATLTAQADGGDADAQFKFGYALVTGQGIAKDTGRGH